VDAAAVRPFWATALGYVEGPDQDGGPDLRDPLGRGPRLWFQRMDPPRTDRNRIHLDVFVTDPETGRRRVDAAVAAGGRLVDDGHAPSFWVLADPEGNEVCVCTGTSAVTDPPPAAPAG
jgi:4a-hydroxytetrahydrobiopterin dehydratase